MRKDGRERERDLSFCFCKSASGMFRTFFQFYVLYRLHK